LRGWPGNSRAIFVCTLSQTRNQPKAAAILNLRVPTRLLRHIVVLGFLWGAALAFASWTSAEQAVKSAARGSFRTVSDETGRTVRIPVPVRRVVSLAPSVTESIYALGLENLLVGDTDYCDYPEAATKLHKVGGATNPSLEEIAQLKPDVVLVIKSLNRLETVQQLERLGIATYSVDPHNLDEIRSSVHRLADVLGNPRAGDALDAELLREEKLLQQKLQTVPPARALFVVWTDPLISVGKHTFIADALAHAGATSVVESSQDWPHISLEEMVRLQPQFLVFANSHSEQVARDVEALAKRPGWDLLDAVKQRRFVVIGEAINRPAPRLFSAVEDLARQLHPEAFRPAATTQSSSVPKGKG
jgi:iron complex transport system substrate-binding protein